MNQILHQGEFEPESYTGTLALSMRESTFDLFCDRISAISSKLSSAKIQIFAKEQLSFEALLRGQVDFMILPHDISQPPTRSRDLIWEQIEQDEMICLMNPKHSLANKPLSIEDYLSCQHVGILDKDLSEPYFEQLLTQQYQPRQVRI